MRKTIITGVLIGLLALAGLAAAGALYLGLYNPEPPAFDGGRALRDIETQLSFGPRTPGSPGHSLAVAWIQEELGKAGWDAEVQETSYLGFPVSNVIGRRGESPDRPWIILGAHYDTRLVSEKDPDPSKVGLPVPGANDGGSGVAVLLELARILPGDLDANVWLVFFDEEDNGNLGDRQWAMGSSAFVDLLEEVPDQVVILDMIGDADLNIYYETNSDPGISAEIWAQAAALGYTGQFIPLPKYAILDDHTPFLRAGIRAVDIIDFDFPYHHTTSDTLDKVSAESLDAVGETIFAWLTRQDED